MDLDIAEMQTLFYEHQEEIKHEINNWRNDGEQELVNWWNKGRPAAPSEDASSAAAVSG